MRGWFAALGLSALAVGCGTDAHASKGASATLDAGYGQAGKPGDAAAGATTDIGRHVPRFDAGEAAAADAMGTPGHALDAGVGAGDGARPSASLTDHGNGTVSDSASGLTWQQKSAPGRFTWEQAQRYCAMLMLEGGGWRVPTRDELQTLLVPNAAPITIDARYFPDTPLDWFWTSTPAAPGFVWIVDFMTGLSYPNVDPTYKSSLRCVR